MDLILVKIHLPRALINAIALLISLPSHLSNADNNSILSLFGFTSTLTDFDSLIDTGA